RWRSLTPVGQPIPGTRFIAFKVPLKGAINQRLTPTQKFTPKNLIAAMKALNVELGLIIDLTYTTRYYEVKDLPKNVQYKKLYTVGFEVPDNATILQFKKWVRKFLWENAGNGKYQHPM
ncbi:DUS11 phosphatase, partial [Donacobius atricapilla]|nr:DUS11 phosphatase [Donacobius atricapilla]